MHCCVMPYSDGPLIHQRQLVMDIKKPPAAGATDGFSSFQMPTRCSLSGASGKPSDYNA